MFQQRKTRFQLILPVDSQNVTKNRTDQRMQVKVIQICQINCWDNSFQSFYGTRPKPSYRTVRPSRIVGQGYSQAGTFWCVLNVSLRASGTQVRLDIFDQLCKQFGWYRGALLCIEVDTFWENRYVWKLGFIQ